MKCDERSARHSYNEGRIKFGKKMYFELGSWEENRIFGRKGEKAKFETRGCGRFLGPELSNSKTASILHRTQTP